jgi:radical SAM protein with 4Fe4S-binding SPASM domain
VATSPGLLSPELLSSAIGFSDSTKTIVHAEHVGGAQRSLRVVGNDYHPSYVVWELTLACDQHCTHCGSRAGAARPSELSVAEARDVASQIARMGAQEVALIGGEAYLHDAFFDVIADLTRAGVRVSMVSGGYGIDGSLAMRMAEAGLQNLSISIDGVGATHDAIRAKKGSYAQTLAALAHGKSAGLSISANTNVNRFNQGELETLYETLRETGIDAWQVQLTVPLGNAADRPDLVLQPYDLIELFPRIAALKKRSYSDGILLMPGNNLGFFGPEEALLRSANKDGKDHFRGCMAGRYLLGIESNGDVKGCPSLQSKHYVGASLKKTSLEEAWSNPLVGYSREPRELWGFCATCDFAEVCSGGCTFTAHALLGKPGNNPYCHYRAIRHRQAGLRERLVFVEAAPGEPFDNGRFRLSVEAWDAAEPAEARLAGPLIALRKRRP